MATIRKRGKSWQAQIRLADHPPQSKSFSTKAAAEQWARITTHQLLDDHDAPTISRHSLASILEQYREKIVILKISEVVETTVTNRLLREDFAQTSLHGVTKITVSAYRDARPNNFLTSKQACELLQVLSPFSQSFFSNIPVIIVIPFCYSHFNTSGAFK